MFLKAALSFTALVISVGVDLRSPLLIDFHHFFLMRTWSSWKCLPFESVYVVLIVVLLLLILASEILVNKLDGLWWYCWNTKNCVRKLRIDSFLRLPSSALVCGIRGEEWFYRRTTKLVLQDTFRFHKLDCVSSYENYKVVPLKIK
jgi:hypothetical protein